MSFLDFVEPVVADGIAAAVADCGAETDKGQGAVAGFEMCRGRTPEQLAVLLDEAGRDRMAAYGADDYWYWACRHAEVEWVCNVISAALANKSQPVILTPTMRGAMKAAEILGYADVFARLAPLSRGAVNVGMWR